MLHLTKRQGAHRKTDRIMLERTHGQYFMHSTGQHTAEHPGTGPGTSTKGTNSGSSDLSVCLRGCGVDSTNVSVQPMDSASAVHSATSGSCTMSPTKAMDSIAQWVQQSENAEQERERKEMVKKYTNAIVQKSSPQDEAGGEQPTSSQASSSIREPPVPVSSKAKAKEAAPVMRQGQPSQPIQASGEIVAAVEDNDHEGDGDELFGSFNSRNCGPDIFAGFNFRNPLSTNPPSPAAHSEKPSH